MKDSLTLKVIGIEIDLPLWLIILLVTLAILNALLWGCIGVYEAFMVIA